MRSLFALLGFVVLCSCNGVSQKASVESGDQSTNGTPAASLTRSTLSLSSSTVQFGNTVTAMIQINDQNGAPFLDPVQVLFYTNGGTSRGTFSSTSYWGYGLYTSEFTPTQQGTATKIRALVNYADLPIPNPTITVMAPDMNWSTPGKDFGYIATGTSTAATNFILSNTGNLDAVNCSSPVLSNTTDFTIMADGCNTANLILGTTCSVAIKANPTSNGLKTATLTRSCQNTGTASSYSKQIKVFGYQTVSTSIAPLTNNFGQAGVGTTNKSATFTFTNAGPGTTIDCQFPLLSDATNFRITQDNCNKTNQSAGQSCTIKVTATPQSTGTKTATLSRTCSSGGVVSTTTDGLTVDAIDPVTLAWSPLVANFGSISVKSKSQSTIFTLKNTNTGTATGCSAPTLSNNTDFKIAFDNCGTASLATGATCTVAVQASPQSAGALATTLSRTCTFDGTYSTTANGITVNGVASTASLAWFRSAYDLGDVFSGKQSNVFSIDLQSTGLQDATGCTAPALTNSTDFTIVSDTCGTNDLVSGDKCSVTVKSLPTGVGPITSNLSRDCTVGGSATTTLNSIGTSTTIASVNDGAGQYHTCVIMSDGLIKCWGEDSDGQLGNDSGPIATAKEVVGVTNAISFSAYTNHSCAVRSDNTVGCWGKNDFGQLGDGTKTDSPIPVLTTVTNGTQVAVGDGFSCAILTDNTIKCWGLGTNGQLGNNVLANSLVPVSVSGINNATAITAGSSHACALLSDNSIKCWGFFNGTVRGTPAAIAGINNAVSVSAGNQFTCAVRAAGSVVSCWGDNDFGQLGNGNTTDQANPVNVAIGGTVTRLEVGGQHACAVLNDGSMKCWGKNNLNQIGDNAFTNRSSPTVVTGITTAAGLTLGIDHSCALLSDGSMKCWGQNESAFVLGEGSADYTFTPNLISSIPNIIDVSQGISFTCAVNASGNVFCWGANAFGQLGDGTTLDHKNPVAVTGITNAVDVEANGNSVCALLADSSVKCWGYNGEGELGNGSTASSSTPVSTGLTGVTSLKVGYNGACALLTNGTVKCWGANDAGQVGDLTVVQKTSPTQVYQLTNVIAIARGAEHACAVLNDKTVKCWGSDEFGSIGNGAPLANSTLPAPLKTLSNVIGISAHGYTSCALIQDGSVNCWGYNANGQVGDGSTTNQSSPVSTGLYDVTSISSGLYLTCAHKTNGPIVCSGQLKENTLPAWTPIYGFTAASVSIWEDPCAINSSGDLYCWGVNNDNKTQADTYSIRTVNGF